MDVDSYGHNVARANITATSQHLQRCDSVIKFDLIHVSLVPAQGAWSYSVRLQLSGNGPAQNLRFLLAAAVQRLHPFNLV